MLKFLHVDRIFNFRIFLVDLNLDFRHVDLSRLDELLGPQYMVGKLWMSSFHPNFNHSKIPLVTQYISQTVHEGLV